MEVMTVSNLAEYLNMTPEAVRGQCRKAKIPFVKIGGKYKFFKKIIDEWLENESLKNLQHSKVTTKIYSSERRRIYELQGVK
jgi:excisionase family DNA binding protein